MTTEYFPFLIIALAFGAMAAVVFLVGQFISTQLRVQQRIGNPARTGAAQRRSR